MKKMITAACTLAVIMTAGIACAEDLFFTYLGVTAGGGAQQVSYSEWVVDHRETKSSSGTYFSGGPIIDIFVDRLIGEFSIQYMNTMMSASNLSVQHLYYTATGKYAFYMGDTFFAVAGAGLYFESGPSDRSYNGGAGANGVLGAGLHAGHDWRIMLDVSARYGNFGIGEEATRLSYGISVAAVHRVGRL